MHLINVHGEEVEILRRDDEVYPHIPQIESLLGGIATEMGVCCSLFWPGTPALPSICFEVDPRPSETRSCPSIPSRTIALPPWQLQLVEQHPGAGTEV